MDFKLSF